MKKILTLIALVFAVVTASAQTLNYEQLKDVQAKKLSYLEYTEYTASDGTIFRIDEPVKIGNQSGTNRYNHILTFVPLTTPSNVTGNMYGKELKIKKIRVNKTLTGGNCVSLWVDCGIAGSSYVIDLEPAINNGEVIGDGMTEDQALKEIEKLKKKLDLELLTEEEYKTKRAELVKYIK